MKPDPAAIALLSHSIVDGQQAPLPAIAAGQGARDTIRLSWVSGEYDSWVSGKPAQGFFILNDGPTPAQIALTPAGANGPNPLLTLRSGEWINLPIPLSSLFAGSAQDDGAILVLPFDYAPPPQMGSLWTDASDNIAPAIFTDLSTPLTLAARNGRRAELFVYNGSGADLYVFYGGAPSDADNTHFTIKLPDGGTLIENVFTGDVQGFQVAPGLSPYVLVTEVLQ